MPKPRNIPPAEEGVFHIYNRGNNGNDIFHDEDDFLIFLNVINRCKKKFNISIYHYSLLINHYHFVIRATGKALAQAMQYINFGYSMKHRKKYKRQGRLWQGRYMSEVIDTEEYLSVCSGYVELNALKHQIVGSPTEYRWSSYHHYASDQQDVIVDDNPDYLDLATTDQERQLIYRELTKIRTASIKCLYWEDTSTDRQYACKY